ncbi:MULTISPECIES: SDR family NAD(P)-dependent oxidoreductase [Psychrilyobacter]|uniref:SDR family NAD(P)-dependent oxidoreductase n=1 Tax=Psychrilyobacter piezotolerans TaxID=2293438 RepID=A0ABX9KD54_9FUSO|nr:MULTISPECIES: SDR family oxidoreductase [Psychrilyobacter]MCS5422887.1 SDR family oxidoreductase [Psychrilyobacter sp. S5]NDI76567.1 SDR family oxidoreductase [Psychrilyobacter piezotolerans]RDE58906.1 SDR family NAD(P)-dependent oxidoreductase [Psychrilyobacter sp. S5]REI39418.1 SDR family NAD(P)-dependent oxidoreductase [Psychrilyobacter piezotolerans]
MKYTLITGGSSGIGLKLAHTFAQNNHNLILVARNRGALSLLKENLESLYKIDIKIIPLDISGETGAVSLYETVKKKQLEVDILINNAGMGYHGEFIEKEIRSDLDLINLNIVTPTVLTKLFLRDMLKIGRGRVFNIASTAGFHSGPLMSVYYGTKSYLLNFSEGVAEEFRDSDIRVITLCPGPTKTAFEKMDGIEKGLFKNFHIADPEDVAKYLYKNIDTKKDVLIHGSLNKFMIAFTKFIPRKINLNLIKRIQKKK